jgi:hypothetical protein
LTSLDDLLSEDSRNGVVSETGDHIFTSGKIILKNYSNSLLSLLDSESEEKACVNFKTGVLSRQYKN